MNSKLVNKYLFKQKYVATKVTVWPDPNSLSSWNFKGHKLNKYSPTETFQWISKKLCMIMLLIKWFYKYSIRSKCFTLRDLDI